MGIVVNICNVFFRKRLVAYFKVESESSDDYLKSLIIVWLVPCQTTFILDKIVLDYE